MPLAMRVKLYATAKRDTIYSYRLTNSRRPVTNHSRDRVCNESREGNTTRVDQLMFMSINLFRYLKRLRVYVGRGRMIVNSNSQLSNFIFEFI